MKRRLFSVVVTLLFCVGVMSAQAVMATEEGSQPATDEVGGVAINEENFPDYKFRNYISNIENGIDTDGNGALSLEEIGAVKTLELPYPRSFFDEINTLQGIEYFTALTDLKCSNNSIESLDLSKNTKLESLDCHNNRLTSLDLSKNTALKSLICYENRLTSLNLSENTNLTEINCEQNLLIKLDVSGCSALTTLVCSSNRLEELDFSSNTALKKLYCSENWLKELDVTKNTALTHLGCYNNQLITLDVTQNKALTNLGCGYNLLTALDVSENTALEYLYCNNNELVTLDVSKTVVSTTYPEDYFGNSSRFVKDGTTLTSLDSNFKMENIDANSIEGGNFGGGAVHFNEGSQKITYSYNVGNNLTAPFTLLKAPTDGTTLVKIDSRNFPDYRMRDLIKNGYRYEYDQDGFKKKSERIDTDRDGLLSTEEVAACTAIIAEEPDDYYERIGDMTGIELFTALTHLRCDDHSMVKLDVTENPKLAYLRCDDNQLTTLDVAKNKVLTYLRCDDNQLTALDVTKNPKLTYLKCDNNQLTTLDVTKNKVLTSLKCYGNQLTALDVIQNPALTELDCGGNLLTKLDVTRNLALTSLRCYDNKLNTLDVTMNPALTELYCSGNSLNTLNVTQNPVLTKLNCNNNGLDVLDVTKNPALTILWCDGNQLTTLDVTNNLGLKVLACGGNQLTTLDVTQHPKIEYLYCENNRLTTLDIGQITNLRGMQCAGNRLVSVDLSKVQSTLSYPFGDMQNASWSSRYVADGTLLSLLDPAFDVNKVTNLSGGNFDNDKVTYDAGSDTITYTYDMQNEKASGVTFTMTKTAPPESANIIFRVVHGTWADGTTADKVEAVALTNGEGTLATIPSGMVPDTGYKNGQWNVVPTTDTNGIKGEWIYVYSFEKAAEGTSSTPSVPETRVAVDCDSNGTVSPQDGTYILYGHTQVYTFTPNEGYEVANVSLDGEDLGPITSLELKGDGKTHTITVHFKPISCDGGEGCPSRHLQDVAVESWYHEAVDYVVAHNLMTGTTATTFSPDERTNRGMIVTILYRLEGAPAVEEAPRFDDVEAGQWYTDAIQWAAENGIVAGYTDQRFAPNEAITREQMAAILYRYAAYKNYDQSIDADLGQYTDRKAISDYAFDAMCWANTQGLINGLDETTIQPQGTAIRAQTAAMLMRFCENIVQ